jgi:pyridoxal phosphate phosphatase PHOSPHO2
MSCDPFNFNFIDLVNLSSVPSQGLLIDRIRGSLPESEARFIYVGDGAGDYCPTLKLEGGDFVLPRKDYPLWNRICSDPKLVHATVHDWSNGEELENILLNLVNKLVT